MRENSRLYTEDLRQAIYNSVGIDCLEGKSVLVTGATGTIGSFIVDELLEYNNTHTKQIKIFATSRNIKHLENLFDNYKTENLTYVEYDTLNNINFNFQVDYVIHNAGNAYPSAFKHYPVETIMGNVNGTYNLLNYALSHGTKRFLYVSSGEVYGQEIIEKESFDERYMGQVEPMNARSCYPNSKRLCETLCSSFYTERHLETLVVRPCHVYGPHLTNNDNRAHAQFIRNALKGQKVVLKSRGQQMRSYCYIADCVSGIFTVLSKGKVNNAYNIANKKAVTTVQNLAKTIALEVGSSVIFENKILDSDSPIQKQVLNSEKLEELGWKGQYDIKTGIRHTLKILQQSDEK